MESWWGNDDNKPDPEPIVIYRRVRCPKCNSTETKVTSTQKPIRYHKCTICEQRFKSVEESF